jgi:hypothetical protein
VLSLLSSFLSKSRAMATYPDIMGCEVSCDVAAAGWPLAFLRDYPGMSVVNRVDLVEVLLAADKLSWPAFLGNTLIWSAAVWLAWRLVAARRR